MQEYEVSDRIQLFREMLSCCHKLMLCSYDNTFYHIGAETEEEKASDDLFSLFRKDTNLESSVWEEHTPLLFSVQIGMHWLCCPAQEDAGAKQIYVLGPFFMEDYSEEAINTFFAAAQVSDAMRLNVWKLIQKLPILS